MLLLAFASVLFAVCLIIYPQDALEASRSGLEIWSTSVVPALLPFFIAAELMIAFGVVNFLGVLLEPFMRPLFRIPGSGGFVWAMGFASGFPSGAKFTVRLRQENKLSREEAERLVSFTNSSSPLFIFGAVAVGFFHNPALGVLLAAAHYISNTVVGIIMRFYKRTAPASHSQSSSFSIKEAWKALQEEQENDKRPLGKKLGDALNSSIHTLFMIGGFVVLFSVIYRLLHVTGSIHYLAVFPSMVLQWLHFSQELAFPWLSGFFEITVGSKLTSDLSDISLLQKAMIVSFILGFSGFSVHAQVASLLAESDIRYKPFFVARWLHGVLASFITYVIWEPLYIRRAGIPTFSQGSTENWISAWWEWTETTIATFGHIITISALLFYIITIHLYGKTKIHAPPFHKTR